MNWLQLAQRVHRESGRSGAGPTAYASATKDHARLFDWVSDAWLNLQSLPREWRWMLRSHDGLILAGVSEYTGTDLGIADFGRWRVPSETYTVRAYSAAAPENVWRLKYADMDRFTSMFLDSSLAPGVPQLWAIGADNHLWLGPDPDADYRVKADYITEPQVLADDGDEPGMPSRFHMVLVWRALMELARFDAAPELLARAADNHDALMGALIHDQAAPLTLHIRPLG